MQGIVSYRTRRAADIATVTNYPLVVHEKNYSGVARSDVVAAAEEGLSVYVDAEPPYPLSSGVHVGILFNMGDPYASRLAPLTLADIDRAQDRMYRLEFSPAATELLSKAIDRVPLERGETETMRVMARGIAAMSDGRAVLPEHVAEALSYRKPRAYHTPAQP